VTIREAARAFVRFVADTDIRFPILLVLLVLIAIFVG